MKKTYTNITNFMNYKNILLIILFGIILLMLIPTCEREKINVNNNTIDSLRTEANLSEQKAKDYKVLVDSLRLLKTKVLTKWVNKKVLLTDTVYRDIVALCDSVIVAHDTIIVVQDSIIKEQVTIIETKEKIIDLQVEQKKEIKKTNRKKIAIGVLIGIAIGTVFSIK